MKIRPLIKNRFISSIIGTIAIYIGVSFILPMNNLSVYITSYIHLKQEFITMHYGIILNLLVKLFLSLSTPLGGVLENKIGFFYTILTGYILIFIGNICFLFQQNIFLCFVICIIIGIGDGIAMSLLIKNLTFYHPNRKGIICAISGIGFVFIITLFNIIGEKIICYDGYTLNEDEDEEFYPEYIAKRIKIYFTLSLITTPISLIIAIIFLYEYKPETYIKSDKRINDNNNCTNNKNMNINDTEEEESDESDDNETNIKNKADTNDNSNNKLFHFDPNNEIVKEMKKKAQQNVKKAIKSCRFWRIVLFIFCFKFPIRFIIDTGRIIGSLIGLNGKLLQYVMIFQTLFAIIIGPLFGLMVDKKEPLLIFRIASISIIIPGVILFFFLDNLYYFLTSLVFVMIGDTAILIAFHPLIMEIFGIQESVILGGIINSFGKLSEIISNTIAFVFSFLYSNEEIYVPYKYIYIVCCSLSIISIFLIFFESNKTFNEDNNKIKDIEGKNNKSENLQVNGNNSDGSDDDE